MIRNATFSEDRTRRFDLIRDWRDEIGAPGKTALFVMLNPSKAGEEQDDPTIRKVVGFGKRWGFGRVVVVNLIATVSTDPWALPPWEGLDIENISIIKAWLALVDLVVAAWGSQPRALCRTIALSEHIYQFRQIAEVPLYCIGTTKSGDPLHPSRAPYTEAPQLL